ncbi:MAG: helical backbone metal receptor [Victivallaceae bacterium]|nr:helical backbone metal receptor [Victivallaceae bacterium]
MQEFIQNHALIALTVILLIACPAAHSAERVVSLSPALTEIIFLIGGGERAAGRSSACDYPQEAMALPVCGEFGNPSMERIAAARPDLVVSDTLIVPSHASVLRSLGIETIVHPCRNSADYLFWLERLGKELGCEKRTVAERQRFDGRISVLKKLPRNGAKVLWVLSDSPLISAGSDSFLSEMTQLAGAENIGDVRRTAYFRMSRDYVIKARPDVVLWAAAGPPPDARDGFWGTLEAVKNKKVFDLRSDSTVLRPGPRMPDGAEKLRRMLECARH